MDTIVLNTNTRENLNFFENNFDLLRVLAAFQVILVHGGIHLDLWNEYPLLGRMFSFFPGVPIFFTISGYLVSASWERNRSYRTYFLNRFLRIYPALWVCFILSLITVLLIFLRYIEFSKLAIWAAAQMSIVQFYNPDFLRDFGIGVLNGSLWTIPVEIQFYIILSFVYNLSKRFNSSKVGLVLIFLFLILILILINFLFVEFFASKDNLIAKIASVTIFPYLYMFFWGVIMQIYKKHINFFFINKAMWWLLIFLIAQVVSSNFNYNFTGIVINPISYLILGCLTISIAYSYTDKLNNLLKGNDISYRLYIYHMVILNILVELDLFSKWVNLIVMIFTTTLMAYMSWKLLEKPILSLKVKLIPRVE